MEDNGDAGHGTVPPGFSIPRDALQNLPAPVQEALKDPGVEAQLLSFTAAFASGWAGPYPPPELIKGYEEALQGSANRIFRMAEEQQKHRHHLEKITVEGGNRRAWWGLWLGFAISLVVLGLGTLIILEGYAWAGGAVMGVDVVALAGVFVYGRFEQRKERENKDTQTQLPSPGQQGQAGPPARN